jgi:DNA-binding NarL/FixJ family response regulator
VGVRTTIREAGDRATALGEVVLVDEHPIWLDALEAILSANGIRVVGKATTPEAALGLVCSEQPGVLIASLDLPSSEMDGVELLRRARERSPEIRIVSFASHDDAFSLSAAVSAGADAYLPKTAAAPEVMETVRECLLGEGRAASTREPLGNGEQTKPALTGRELEIITLAARGYTNAQIAQRLWVTQSTVKFHLVNAYRKLGVSNRTQAARYLFEQRLSQQRLERST